MSGITIGSDKAAELTQFMHDCAEAVKDDSELNAGGNGVPGIHAMRVLDEVAEILGIDGPRAILDREYGGAW